MKPSFDYLFFGGVHVAHLFICLSCVLFALCVFVLCLVCKTFFVSLKSLKKPEG